MELLERIEYLQILDKWKDKDVIKVITGIRRCGKSTLLAQFQQRLIAQGVPQERVIVVNLEDYSFIDLVDPKKLHDHIMSHATSQEKTYVFLDEVQNVQDFQKVVDSLYLRKNLDIYITGSNANLLSGELATLLSGRYVTIEMLPLSFSEFAQARSSASSLSGLYRQYIQTSSFPYVIQLEDDAEMIQEYLEGIYSTVILKDAINRLERVDPLILESIVRFLMSSIGNRVSTKKIADSLGSEGRKTSVRSVERYLNALLDSYILYRVKRYDIKGKQHLKTLEKYYCVDPGLRYSLVGGRGFDVGSILENVVFLELLRRGCKVFIGKVGELEVDFVAEKQGHVTYIQVAASVRDPQTLQRELRPLERIDDNHPKLVLSLDDDPEGDYKGIKRINALEWLMESN